MKVFVCGATGVLGRRAVVALVAAGHQVTAVARSADSGDLLRRMGASPVPVDVFDPRATGTAMRGHHAVVNLMTRIPPPSRAIRPAAWRDNDRIRCDGSAAIAAAARAAGADRLVQESVTFIYPGLGDQWIDEAVPVAPAGVVASAAVAERHAREFGDAVVLRFGALYGPDSRQTLAQVGQARHGLSLSTYPADAYLSMLWLDDAGPAVVAALSAPPGTYNVVDDEPLPRGENDAILARAVDRRRLFAPVPALTRAVPSMAPARRSQRVSARKLREATGWSPRVASARQGWPKLLTTLRTATPD